MSEPKSESHVGIRISSKTLSPEAITNRLGMSPSKSYHAGDHINHNPRYARVQTNLWILDSELPESAPLEEHLHRLVSRLETNWPTLKHTEIEAALFCTVVPDRHQDGFSFSKELLARLVALSADLNITLLSPADDVAAEAGDKPLQPNAVGHYSLKLVYPEFYNILDQPVAAFSPRHRQHAQRLVPGALLFVYVTSPVKGIIALAKVTGPVYLRDDVKRPYALPLEFVIGPKAEAVRLPDLGVEFRPRPGDTVYAVAPEVARSIITELERKPDLEGDLLAAARQRRPQT